MKVTQVALRPTNASDLAGRPSLTPELLAAVGARYSRNNEGLDAILARVDQGNLDSSVDSIFRMVDYGHQSIADMTPVAIFIDGISILLAYLIWSWSPTAGGQESSTRYIRLTREGLVEPELFGVPPSKIGDWYEFMERSFEAYSVALSFWEKVANTDPSLTRLPPALLNDPSDRAKRQVARIRRNFGFDRARYFLPLAAKTNVMLLISARGWTQLCQHLMSHWLPEAGILGAKIRDELSLAAPRMTRHAKATQSFVSGYQAELDHLAAAAQRAPEPVGEAPCSPSIEVHPPVGVRDNELTEALGVHDNRYAFIGPAACRTSVRFSWSAVSIAEIRDLNRHRTGHKYCSLVPVGFYSATDQLPHAGTPSLDSSLASIGLESARRAKGLLAERQPYFAAWLLLGAQFAFEHTTTLDKFVYEAELRTGPGAHFRYAAHLRDSVDLLSRTYPRLAAAVLLGSNEPE